MADSSSETKQNRRQGNDSFKALAEKMNCEPGFHTQQKLLSNKRVYEAKRHNMNAPNIRASKYINKN